MNVAEAILKSLDDWGSYPVALSLGSAGEATYTPAAQLRRDITDLAALFRSWGVGPRDIVALFLENSLDFVRAFTALLFLGAVPVPLKFEYRKLELEEVFSNARPSGVVVEESHYELIATWTSTSLVIGHNPGRFRLLVAPQRPRASAELSANIASLNYTYRGYGYPLGALVPHSQYLHGARVLQEGLQGAREDRLLVLLPMAHIFALVGCVLVPLLYGMTMVIARTLHPRVIFDLIRTHNVNTLTAVPEIFRLLARTVQPGMRFPSLRTFVCGGSTLGTEDYEQIRDLFSVQLLHGYGLTEFAPVSRNVRGQARAGTVGPPCNGIEIAFEGRDELGRSEILVRCPSMSTGYYCRHNETAEAFTGSWFRTGDFGRLVNGHLVFEGEKKATRKVNGNMVDLNEVQRALRSSSGIRDASVDFVDGQLVARVSMEDGPPDRERIGEVKRHLKHIIAAYKIPSVITAL